jgi:uncharacterized membrane protein YfhO
MTLRIRTFYFPGWKAYTDDVATDIAIEKHAGVMLISAPKGTHTLLIRFEDTAVRYYAKIISLVSLLVVLPLLFFPRRLRGQ